MSYRYCLTIVDSVFLTDINKSSLSIATQLLQSNTHHILLGCSLRSCVTPIDKNRSHPLFIAIAYNRLRWFLSVLFFYVCVLSYGSSLNHTISVFLTYTRMPHQQKLDGVHNRTSYTSYPASQPPRLLFVCEVSLRSTGIDHTLRFLVLRLCSYVLRWFHST